MGEYASNLICIERTHIYIINGEVRTCDWASNMQEIDAVEADG